MSYFCKWIAGQLEALYGLSDVEVKATERPNVYAASGVLPCPVKTVTIRLGLVDADTGEEIRLDREAADQIVTEIRESWERGEL